MKKGREKIKKIKLHPQWETWKIEKAERFPVHDLEIKYESKYPKRVDAHTTLAWAANIHVYLPLLFKVEIFSISHNLWYFSQVRILILFG